MQDRSSGECRLKPGLTEEDQAEIFDDHGNGPLAPLSARIRMAYALGLLDANERKDFDIIREIRNVFAHAPMHIEFTTKEVADACEKLEILKLNQLALAPDILNIAPLARQRFVLAVSVYYWKLVTYFPGPRTSSGIFRIPLTRETDSEDRS